MNLVTRIYFLFIATLAIFFCRAQTPDACKPTIDRKVKLCGNRFLGDSVCPSCKQCGIRLVAVDPGLAVTDFHVMAGGEGFEGYIKEAQNKGEAITDWFAKSIMTRIRPGSYIQFDCIKAKDKSGRIYILQPLFIEL